jgi:hypothetical protein
MPVPQSYPVGVPIPVSLVVTTRTRPMLKLYGSPDSLFPAPPVGATGVRLRLNRIVRIRAQTAGAVVEDHVHILGGFGPSTISATTHPVQSTRSVVITREDPVWLPEDVEKIVEKNGKGRWQRRTRFESSITFSCTPTMDLDIIVSSVNICFTWRTTRGRVLVTCI